eukprot:928682-Amphidinium_carterae.1
MSHTGSDASVLSKPDIEAPWRESASEAEAKATLRSRPRKGAPPVLAAHGHSIFQRQKYNPKDMTQIPCHDESVAEIQDYFCNATRVPQADRLQENTRVAMSAFGSELPSSKAGFAN